MKHFKNLHEIIEKFDDVANKFVEGKYTKEDENFLDTFDLDMAKAFYLDEPHGAVRVAKMILALKEIGEIKVKIE